MLMSLLCLSFLGFSKKPDTRYFELRVYYCHPGRLDALIQRFTNHTTKITAPNKNHRSNLARILN